MIQLITILNAAAVGLFGAILSASFCEIKWTRRNKLLFVSTLVLIGVLQVDLFVWFGEGAIRFWYPLITHLPLMIMFWYLSRKKLWSVISVLTAYLCCQLRRWIALFCVELLGGGDLLQDILEVVITIPLLLGLLRFAAPAVRSMSRYPRTVQAQFGLLPVVGYLFDYLTRVYTDWLIRGVPAAVEFMPFVCSAAYLVFVLYSSGSLRRQAEMEQVQEVLDLQVRQSARQIASMKKAQELTAAYRHDLHHHLQYLSACIETGATEQAQEYIRNLYEGLTQQTVTQYCENTAANLVLSSFAGRAAEAGITMNVRVQLGETLRISDNDMCVLLSNALENALNACAKVKAAGGDTSIAVNGYAKEERVFLEIVNSCVDDVVFENDIPVTKEAGHGIGVRSIVAVVEKYHGIYVFEQRDKNLVLRLSI